MTVQSQKTDLDKNKTIILYSANTYSRQNDNITNTANTTVCTHKLKWQTKNAKLQLTDGKLIINGNMKNGMHRMTIRPPLGILPALTPSAPS